MNGVRTVRPRVGPAIERVRIGPFDGLGVALTREVQGAWPYMSPDQRERCLAVDTVEDLVALLEEVGRRG